LVRSGNFGCELRERGRIVAINVTDSHFTTLSGQASSDLAHDLHTPLAVIRMQAQLLMRLTRRGTSHDMPERERYLVGLRRIDDAVTKLNLALERLGLDEKAAVPNVH
jgi:signal transduction histidine kinase